MPAASTHDVDASIAAARALWQQNEVGQAEALLRELHLRVPAREDAGTLLAEVLRNQGKFSAAAAIMLDVCRANAFEPSVCLRAGQFARQCDRHGIAQQICDGTRIHPQVPLALLILAGHVARESGDFALARKYYLAALDTGVNLDGQEVLGALANTRHYDDPQDPDLARLERGFGNAQQSVRSRASAGFGLAKARDDLADYARAADVLRKSNEMVHAAQPWDAAQWRASIAARRSEVVAPASDAGDASAFVPVFIVGAPRSGTTLTASLLAKSSPARDRGELRALRYAAERLIEGGHLGAPGAVAEAAQLYHALAVQDDAPSTWYLDQDPLNFRYLHVAAAMFPQARVIHLRRDRRDTALSLWSQDFASRDAAFAYDFDDMRAFFAGQDALMQHWHQQLPLPILELDYETLVAETGPTLAKLREFIGAPARGPGAAVDAAPIQSASVWQARQPVYRTSVGRWQHYAPYVPELARFG